MTEITQVLKLKLQELLEKKRIEKENNSEAANKIREKNRLLELEQILKHPSLYPLLSILPPGVERIETATLDRILEYLNKELYPDIKAYGSIYSDVTLEYNDKITGHYLTKEYSDIRQLLIELDTFKKEVEIKKQLPPKTKIYFITTDYDLNEKVYFLSKKGAEDYKRNYAIEESINENSLYIEELWVNP